MNITIFSNSLLGTGIGRCSGTLVTHGASGPPSALQKTPFIEFIPLKKRKPRIITGASYLLVLEGHEIPDPPAPFITMPSQANISPLSCSTEDISFDRVYTFEGTRQAFDPKLISEFNRFIDQFSSRFVADYRRTEDTTSTDSPDTENSHFPLKYIEGSSNEILQTEYERSTEARAQCLLIHGYTCKVCNFDFQKIYGEIGNEFIHVHHIEPLSSKKEEYEVDPQTDLIPVCPNCHAMIHRRSPPFTIEELKKIIAEPASGPYLDNAPF